MQAGGVHVPVDLSIQLETSSSAALDKLGASSSLCHGGTSNGAAGPSPLPAKASNSALLNAGKASVSVTTTRYVATHLGGVGG